MYIIVRPDDVEFSIATAGLVAKSLGIRPQNVSKFIISTEKYGFCRRGKYRYWKFYMNPIIPIIPIIPIVDVWTV